MKEQHPGPAAGEAPASGEPHAPTRQRSVRRTRFPAIVGADHPTGGSATADPAALVLRALADGRPRDRGGLARECGLGETGLEGALSRLSQLGVALIVEPGAIALPRPVELLDAERIAHGVPRLRSESVHVRFAVDSTNTVLTERMRAGAAAPELCTAEIQTAGRGRQGRRWVSGPGRSLVLSVSWRFPAGSREPSGLSLAIGVALVEALEAGGLGQVMLKWPNDLVVVDRKLAGVLVEASHSGSGSVGCVIGVGFNLDLEASDAGRIDQPWTDFAREFGRVPARNALAARAAGAMLDACETYRHCGLGPFAPRWRERDALRDRPVRVLSRGAPIEGTARGIDGAGALLVEHRGGVLRYEAGEVRVRAGGA